MKKWIVATVAILISGGLHAQTKNKNLRFGIKGGVNLSSIDYTSPLGDKRSMKPGVGFYGGPLIEFSFPRGSKLKLQSEAHYSMHQPRYSQTVSGYDVTFIERFNQISIPIMAKYFITPALSIIGGLSLNFNLENESVTKSKDLSTGASSTNSTSWPQENKNSFEPGALIGAEYYLYKGLFIEARYNAYFNSPYKATSSSFKTDFQNLNSIQLGLGYKF